MNAMTQERVWEVGWDGHERAQLLRTAALPFACKLQWLEEAHHLALAIQKGREKQNNQAATTSGTAASTCGPQLSENTNE
jgi:hypothetical protein